MIAPGLSSYGLIAKRIHPPGQLRGGFSRRCGRFARLRSSQPLAEPHEQIGRLVAPQPFDDAIQQSRRYLRVVARELLSPRLCQAVARLRTPPRRS